MMLKTGVSLAAVAAVSGFSPVQPSSFTLASEPDTFQRVESSAPNSNLVSNSDFIEPVESTAGSADNDDQSIKSMFSELKNEIKGIKARLNSGCSYTPPEEIDQCLKQCKDEDPEYTTKPPSQTETPKTCPDGCGRGECQNGECTREIMKALVWGDPHLVSWDLKKTDFQGHCSYVYAKLSGSVAATKATPYFQLVGRQAPNPELNRDSVTFVQGYTMNWTPFEGRNNKVQFEFGNKLKINDEIAQAPSYNQESQILIADYDGSLIYFGIESEAEAEDPENNYKLKIKMNAYDHYMYIQADSMYDGKIVGLLGIPDQDDTNDIIQLDGSVYTKSMDNEDNVFEWGNMWRVDPETFEFVEGDCEGDIKLDQQCSADDQEEIAALCDQLSAGSFAQCDEGLDMAIEACKYDLCTVGENERQKLLCELMSTRENICKEAGKVIAPWRDENCPIQCPNKMSFKKDASGCVQTTQTCQLANQPACDKPAEDRCVCDDETPYWNPSLQECVKYCPSYTEFESNLYENVTCTKYFINEDIKPNHAEAKAYCNELKFEGKRLTLSQIRNTAEAELHAEIRRNMTGNINKNFWMDGARDMTVENPLEKESAVFRYTDGTKVCNFWWSGEPNNFRRVGEHNLVAYGNNVNDVLNDFDANSKELIEGIICEARTCVPECDAEV